MSRALVKKGDVAAIYAVSGMSFQAYGTEISKQKQMPGLLDALF